MIKSMVGLGAALAGAVFLGLGVLQADKQDNGPAFWLVVLGAVSIIVGLRLMARGGDR